jgi:hypothetical protein
MTVFAQDGPMRPCKRERRIRVVERSGRPGCRGVAGLTRHGKLSSNVIRVFRGLIDSLMARIALKGSMREDTVLVTRDAGDGPVAS